MLCIVILWVVYSCLRLWWVVVCFILVLFMMIRIGWCVLLLRLGLVKGFFLGVELMIGCSVVELVDKVMWFVVCFIYCVRCCDVCVVRIDLFYKRGFVLVNVYVRFLVLLMVRLWWGEVDLVIIFVIWVICLGLIIGLRFRLFSIDRVVIVVDRVFLEVIWIWVVLWLLVVC